MMTCLTQLAYWMTNLQQLCGNEEGQGLAEYSLIVLAVVFMIISAMGVFIGPLSELYATIGIVFQPFVGPSAF